MHCTSIAAATAAFALLVPLGASAQSVSFNETTQSYAEVSGAFDVEDIAPGEIFHYVSSAESQYVTLERDYSGDIRKILRHTGHENLYPTWYTPPERTVMDEGGRTEIFASATVNGGLSALQGQAPEGWQYSVVDGKMRLYVAADGNHATW